MNKIFLNAAYAIALSSVPDKYHQKAENLAKEIETENTKLITTRAVTLEIGNALAKLRYRAAAIELLNSIEEDPNIEIDLFLNCQHQNANRSKHYFHAALAHSVWSTCLRATHRQACL